MLKKPRCPVPTITAVVVLVAGCSSSSGTSSPGGKDDAGVTQAHDGGGRSDGHASTADGSATHDARADGPRADAIATTDARPTADGGDAAAPGDSATNGDVGSDAKTVTVTAAGVTIPSGWTLDHEDRFGTAASQNVQTMAELHAKYYEGQFYNRDANGLVTIPNTVINMEQETYVHFETAIVFGTDHLTIQGRGHPDNSITSAELVSIYVTRSFCIEGRYQIPSTDKSWPAFWWYADTSGGDASEIDFEQPVTPNQGVHDVSMHNHPTEGTVTILDPDFTTAYMTWTNQAFDGSTAPHFYTACYDDAAGELTRYIDGAAIYDDVWKWNATLGGTGHGPDATTIVNLAVGGSWPGNVAVPSAYSADLDLYSIAYYGP